MATTATRSRENTRARLLDAAAQVFAEVGLDGASVEAVCERAGFTRGAFYSNFESKDELFLMLAGRVADQRVSAVRARVEEMAAAGAIAEGCDPIALLRRCIARVRPAFDLPPHRGTAAPLSSRSADARTAGCSSALL